MFRKATFTSREGVMTNDIDRNGMGHIDSKSKNAYDVLGKCIGTCTLHALAYHSFAI